MRRTFLITALLLASCNRSERPEAPTQADAKRLDEAEEMLNELGTEEGAAADTATSIVNSN